MTRSDAAYHVTVTQGDSNLAKTLTVPVLTTYLQEQFKQDASVSVVESPHPISLGGRPAALAVLDSPVAEGWTRRSYLVLAVLENGQYFSLEVAGLRDAEPGVRSAFESFVRDWRFQ